MSLLIGNKQGLYTIKTVFELDIALIHCGEKIEHELMKRY